MNNLTELTVNELSTIHGGKGKPIYWKDLSWKQQKCILSVAGSMIGASITSLPGMLIAGGAAFWSECL
ncbi:hypothetical protein BVJ53_09775 [Lacticaseibacillus chiayiensis]|uniref:Bacteriocin n=1 Tax=Lacticaseibacillus chiayiensis TaxID=2100821 RepID=A0A4Q1TS74_9LACO|nr:hypothetical protein [Lacticaseibacillus chiayiensis]QVI34205.1 hypothetical protein KG086_10460 [Lacticaseibacillus chiayiensis]RXT20868.1 hypothetical protein BVJ53_09775 [Lacticaseibacillus chiayiensis]RXT57940.1 hypothetical protein CHT97_09395 [Lacticaseibacillus chiayiensis]UYN55985.1 hypothetical protein OFW50_10940 [Lacticaseibacillus chiayiensis]